MDACGKEEYLVIDPVYLLGYPKLKMTVLLEFLRISVCISRQSCEYIIYGLWLPIQFTYLNIIA